MSPVAAALVLFAAALGLGRQALATTAVDLCPAAANPCIITASSTITPGSVLDFGARQVILNAGRSLDVGPGIMSINAGGLRLAPNAKLLGPGGFISVTLTGTLELQASGNTLSRIDVSDPNDGGDIELNVGANALIAGALQARGTATEADGGGISLNAGGDVTITAALSAKGGSDAGGGSVSIVSGGTLTVSQPLDVSGGEFDGGDIDLLAKGDLTIQAGASMNVSGGGLSGAGGSVLLVASTGALTIGGKILGTAGGSAAEGGGFGGTVDAIAVLGGLGLFADVDVFGGDGGGGGDGGDVGLSAGGPLTVNANIDADGGKDTTSLGLGDGGGGSVALQGCDVTLTQGHTITTKGATFGVIDVRAGGQMTIAGTLVATQANNLTYRDPAKPPVVPGANTPAPQVLQSCSVPSCSGVCGNHLLDACEVCDDGDPGGSGCCSATCQYEASGVPCSGGVCNGAGRCTPQTTGTTSSSTTSSSSTTTSTSTSSTTITPTTSTTSTTAPGPPVCGNGIVESGETCDDGNTADGDCCSASCQFAAAGTACSDGNACTQSDTCDGAGECTGGSPLSCDDQNPCTDDGECDPAIGCAPSSAKTGFAGVTCRLDAMGAALTQAAPDQLTAAGRRAIVAALRRARTKVNAAAKATGGKRGARLRRNAQTALRGVARAVNAARRRGQIKGPLAGSLVGQVNGALDSAQALGASPSQPTGTLVRGRAQPVVLLAHALHVPPPPFLIPHQRTHLAQQRHALTAYPPRLLSSGA